MEISEENSEEYIDDIASTFGMTEQEVAEVYPKVYEEFKDDFDHIQIISQVGGELDQLMLILGRRLSVIFGD